MPRPREGRRREAALEVALVHVREGLEIGSRDFGARRELRIVRRPRKAHIPRTDVLADVTAEQPIANSQEPLLQSANGRCQVARQEN